MLGTPGQASVASATRPSGVKRGAPRQYSDGHYRRVAAVYQAAEAAGRPPVREVARAFEGKFPGLTDPTDRRARAWVRAARARGFLALAPTEPGHGSEREAESDEHI